MGFTVSVSASETSYNITNNTSVVKVTVKATTSGSSYNNDGMVFKVNCNGQGIHQSTIAVGLNTTKSYSYSYTVSHNDDGTKSCSIWGQVVTGISYGTVTKTGTKTLTTIPRKSTLTAISGSTLGDGVAFAVSRKSSSFKHTLSWTCGSYSGTIISKSTNESPSFTPSMDLANVSPNGTTVSITYVLTTYNGSTSIGFNSYSRNLTIPLSASPTCTLSISDDTGNASIYGGYIQGVSKLRIQVNPTTKYNATVKSYSTLVEGNTYTSMVSTTPVLKNSGTVPVSTTLIDSREYSGRTSSSVDVLSYSKPIISNVSVHRCDWDGTTATDNIRGNHVKVTYSYSITPLSDQNTRQFKINIKKTSDPETSWSTSSLTDYGYSGTNIETVLPADAAYSYNIRIDVTDAFDTTKFPTSVSVGFCLFGISASGKGMTFGGLATSDNYHFAQGLTYDVPVKYYGDCNQLTTGGIYYVGGQGQNRPNNLNGYLENLNVGGSDNCVQTYTTPDGDVYQRNKFNGVWSEWISSSISAMGATGIWQWMKHSNGLAECYGNNFLSSLACTTSSYGTYFGTVGQVNLPFTFTSIYYYNANAYHSGGSIVSLSSTNNFTMSTTGTTYVRTGSSRTIANVTVSYCIKGRWK